MGRGIVLKGYSGPGMQRATEGTLWIFSQSDSPFHSTRDEKKRDSQTFALKITRRKIFSS